MKKYRKRFYENVSLNDNLESEICKDSWDALIKNKALGSPLLMAVESKYHAKKDMYVWPF